MLHLETQPGRDSWLWTGSGAQGALGTAATGAPRITTFLPWEVSYVLPSRVFTGRQFYSSTRLLGSHLPSRTGWFLAVEVSHSLEVCSSPAQGPEQP